MIRYDTDELKIVEDPNSPINLSDEEFSKACDEIDKAVSEKQMKDNLSVEEQGEVNESMKEVYGPTFEEKALIEINERGLKAGRGRSMFQISNDGAKAIASKITHKI